MTSEDRLVSRLNIDKGEYCFFVGAGISLCAGIPLATTDLPGCPSVVTCIRRDYYNSLNKPPLSDIELLAWYTDQKLLQTPETQYSDALNLIGDTPRSRQKYLQKFLDKKKPGETHQSLARLIKLNYFNTIFTTNFDPFLEMALRQIDIDPKVAAHSETISDVSLNDPVPKIMKLHGDYLFSDIKNTKKETESLTANMREKLKSFLREKGLIVIGYAGNDNSVMALFEQLAYDEKCFPFGLYWLYRNCDFPRDRVRTFVESIDGCLLPIDSAEKTLNELITRLE